MNKVKYMILSIGMMTIATVFMIFVIWNETISMATRPFIIIGYLVLMVVAIFLKKILTFFT